jgi:hypothetical protein
MKLDKVYSQGLFTPIRTYQGIEVHQDETTIELNGRFISIKASIP